MVPTSFFLIAMFKHLSEDTFDQYDEPRLHMQRLMRTKLVEFDLSIRILLPLEKAGIITLGDITKWKADDLRKIPQLGATAIARLEALLDSLDLSLAH